MLERCRKEEIDLLLIAGDLFHRQPLLRELKEVSYLLGQLPHTQVVFIAGNHDYIKYDSYYRTYSWPKNVHMLKEEELDVIEFPELETAVYGFSYQDKEIKKCTCQEKGTEHRQKYEILLLHGGDESHVPFQKEKLLNCGYDYIALGHIHKPQVLVKNKMAYSGALEPIDKNDTGPHGYIIGELADSIESKGDKSVGKKSCKTQFIPSAKREYCHVAVKVRPDMTGFALKEEISREIMESGKDNMYKIILTGFHDPQIVFDLSGMDSYGNIVEIVDETVPAYNFERIMENNMDNILGCFIRELKDHDKESIEYHAMCEGVKALMETRRD